MKLLIALGENKGLDSGLSAHFGHCPFFAIHDTATNKTAIVENELDHSNQEATPVDQVMKHRPDAIFSLGMGQRAIRLFRERGVLLKTGDYRTVREVIKDSGRLEDLSQGCAH